MARIPSLTETARPVRPTAPITTSWSISPAGADLVSAVATGNPDVSMSGDGEVDGQQVRVRIRADGAARTVRFTGMTVADGLVASVTVPQGRVLRAMIEWDALRSPAGWELVAEATL